MQNLKTYFHIVLDITILLFGSIAELDAEIRVGVLTLGGVLTLVTIFKVYQQVVELKLSNRDKKIDLKVKEEKARRFFEERYNEPFKQVGDDTL